MKKDYTNTKREFTGVFIPAHIWESKDLIPAEKMLLGEIDALSKNTGWCTAGRQHFADWLHCNPANVSYYTKKLESLGFLEIARTSGAGSKMRVKNAAFYRSEVVNGIDGGGKPGLGVPVNGIDGGGKRGLPKREDKYNDEKKEKEIAPENSIPPKAEPSHIPNSAAPLSPSWGDRPNTTTPARMVDDLRIFYATHSEDFKVMCETAKVRFDSEKMREVLTAFCSYRIKTNQTADTYQNHHAALQKWLIDEKTMRRPAANGKPALEYQPSKYLSQP